MKCKEYYCECELSECDISKCPVLDAFERYKTPENEHNNVLINNNREYQ